MIKTELVEVPVEREVAVEVIREVEKEVVREVKVEVPVEVIKVGHDPPIWLCGSAHSGLERLKRCGGARAGGCRRRCQR